MGRPRISWSTLGRLDFIRVPCPAARMMAVVLYLSVSIPYLYAFLMPRFSSLTSSKISSKFFIFFLFQLLYFSSSDISISSISSLNSEYFPGYSSFKTFSVNLCKFSLIFVIFSITSSGKVLGQSWEKSSK